MAWTDDELVAGMKAYLETHERPIELVLRPHVALQIAGLLQIALKHPTVHGAPRQAGWLILEHIKLFFETSPEISEVLRQGDAQPLSARIDIAALRAAVERGAGHECDEWIDARGRCALCDRRVGRFV